MIVRTPVLSLLVALTAVTPAAADWSSQAVPGSAGADDPRLVFARDGTAVAAWRLFEPPAVRLRAAHRGPDGWRGPCAVGRGHDLLLGPLARGRTRLVYGVLEARARHRLGVTAGRSGRCRRGALRWVAAARRIASPVLAGNRRGDAVLAWFEDRGTASDRVMVAVRRPGGRFGEPRRLATGRLRAVTAAVGPRGDALVAWEARGRVGARFRRAGRERFLRAQTIRSRSTLGARLSAAVARTGAAYLGWTAQARSEGGTFGAVLVQAASKPPGQRRFRRAQRLEGFEGRVLETGALRLGADRDGGAVAAWTGADGVRAAVAGPGGRFAGPVTLEAGATWRLADVAVRPSGAAGVLWEPEPGVAGPVRFAALGAGGGFGPAETVSAFGHSARLALPPAGRPPGAVWIADGGLRLGGRAP